MFGNLIYLMSIIGCLKQICICVTFHRHMLTLVATSFIHAPAILVHRSTYKFLFFCVTPQISFLVILWLIYRNRIVNYCLYVHTHHIFVIACFYVFSCVSKSCRWKYVLSVKLISTTFHDLVIDDFPPNNRSPSSILWMGHF